MQHTVYQFLCPPRTIDIVIQMDDVMTRLVAVSILPDKTGNICRNRLPFKLRRNSEQGIQLTGKSLLSSHQANQTGHIVKHEPSPLPSRTFAIIVTAMGRRTRIERSTPFPLTVPPAHKTGFGVEVRLICPGKTSIFISCFHISQTICQYGYTPIIVCIFQCLCHRFVFEVARNIAQRILVITGTGHHKRNQPLRTDNAGRVVFGSTETGLVGFANIEIAIALHVCIGDDRGSMIANHRSRVVGSTIPFRENTSLTLFLQQ